MTPYLRRQAQVVKGNSQSWRGAPSGFNLQQRPSIGEIPKGRALEKQMAAADLRAPEVLWGSPVT